MPYYRECPYWHCHLDPGELCDCKKETQDAPQEARRMRFARPPRVSPYERARAAAYATGNRWAI